MYEIFCESFHHIFCHANDQMRSVAFLFGVRDYPICSNKIDFNLFADFDSKSY